MLQNDSEVLQTPALVPYKPGVSSHWNSTYNPYCIVPYTQRILDQFTCQTSSIILLNAAYVNCPERLEKY